MSSDGHVTNLVSTALRQDSLTGLCEMLRCVAEFVDAYGVTLWQAIPAFAGAAPEGFFNLAHWNADGLPQVIHRLPWGTVTTDAVVTRQIQHIRDALRDPRVYNIRPLGTDVKIRVFCSVPLEFTDGSLGAVNIYRAKGEPFSKAELREVRKLVALLPSLYDAIRDRLSFRLTRDVNAILAQAERLGTLGTDEDRLSAYLKNLCSSVGSAFSALECTLFLADPMECQGLFRARGTTWSRKTQPRDRSADDVGITAWVLRHNKPVQIFDLSEFEDNPATIALKYPQYPGLTWEGSLHAVAERRKLLRVRRGPTQPPASFIAAPIAVDGQVLGAIRCFGAMKPPYFFAPRELVLLEMVAAAIARYWSNHIHKRTNQKRQFEVLAHQIRGPIGDAYSIVRSLLEQYRFSRIVRSEVEELHSVISYARRASGNLEVLAGPTGGANLPAVLFSAALRKLVVDLVKDFERQCADARVTVNVDKASFGLIDEDKVRVHLGLLEQAVACLLDNAIKFSDPGIAVEIAGEMQQGQFVLSVRNKGLRISSGEVRRLIGWGQRGRQAGWVVDEGSGIGLWIANRVMTLHRGTLRIVPTDIEGFTKVQLMFPSER